MQNGLWDLSDIKAKMDPDDRKRMISHNVQLDWQWAKNMLLKLMPMGIFSDYDEGILMSIGLNIIKWEANKPEDRQYIVPFSFKQLRVLQDRLPRYSNQMLKALEKEGAV